MKVCIAGGGRVGMYLAQSLLSHHHKVTIIEPQEALCRTLADTLDIPVICGDSLSFDTLRTADVASCDAFVAVTNTDETNLVACQIAKREFGVNRTVARASNPKNRDILHTLGVDTVVCGTDNLSHILEREIETDTIRQLLSLGGGTASLNSNYGKQIDTLIRQAYGSKIKVLFLTGAQICKGQARRYKR